MGCPKDQCISPNPAQRDCRHKVSGLSLGCQQEGASLNALPVPLLGLRMEDETTRVAMGLRLGTPLCRPHECSQRKALHTLKDDPNIVIVPADKGKTTVIMDKPD